MGKHCLAAEIVGEIATFLRISAYPSIISPYGICYPDQYNEGCVPVREVGVYASQY